MKINPDRLFGKHAAILGNTGSGKSCTLTSVLQSLFQYDYNGKKLQSAHVVIFDTNGEYKDAFNIDDKHKVNSFYINEDGLKVPYWFMNFDDMDYLFEPTTGTQAPILKRALGLAKSKVNPVAASFIGKADISILKSFVSDLCGNDNSVKKALLDRAVFVQKKLNEYKDSGNVTFDLTGLCRTIFPSLTAKIESLYQRRYLRGLHARVENMDCRWWCRVSDHQSCQRPFFRSVIVS